MLTRREQMMVAGLLAIFLIGLTVRHFREKSLVDTLPVPATPHESPTHAPY